MAEDAIAKARAIAARLAGITATDSQKRKFEGESAGVSSSGGRKLKKIYIPQEKYPDINFIGLLIGPKGSNQKRILEKTGARILVRGRGSSKEGSLEEENDDLHVLISGNSDKEVADAQEEVESIIHNPDRAMAIKREQLARLASDISSTTSQYGPNSVYGGHEKSISVPVPRGLVGFVIGKGGETIRDLQMRSGAHVQVVREDDNASSTAERFVSVAGSEENVAKAKELIETLVADRQAGRVSSFGSGANNSTSSYGPGDNATKHVVANDKVGLIIGKGGATIKGIQSRSGANVQIPSEGDAENPAVRTLVLSGSAEQVSAAKAEIDTILDEDMRNKASVVVVVPNDKVGMIIGRGGETIKAIQDRSGVRVQVPTDADVGTNPPVRTLTIVGPAEGLAYAKYEIECIVAQDTGNSTSTTSNNNTGGSSGYTGSGYANHYGTSSYGYGQSSSYGYGSNTTSTAATTTTDPNDPNSYWNGYYEYAAYYGTEAANAAWGVSAEAAAGTSAETTNTAAPGTTAAPPGTRPPGT